MQVSKLCVIHSPTINTDAANHFAILGWLVPFVVHAAMHGIIIIVAVAAQRAATTVRGVLRPMKSKPVSLNHGMVEQMNRCARDARHDRANTKRVCVMCAPLAFVAMVLLLVCLVYCVLSLVLSCVVWFCVLH